MGIEIWIVVLPVLVTIIVIVYCTYDFCSEANRRAREAAETTIKAILESRPPTNTDSRELEREMTKVKETLIAMEVHQKECLRQTAEIKRFLHERYLG